MAVALIAAFQILTPALNNAFTGIGNTLNAAKRRRRRLIRLATWRGGGVIRAALLHDRGRR